MSQLLAVVYDSPEAARRTADRMRRLAKGRLLHLIDLVIARREWDGKIVLDHSVDPVSNSVLGGAALGSLIGYLMLTPMVGIVGGAAMGALGGIIAEKGLDDKFIRETADQMAPGKAAVFMLVNDVVMEKVAPALAEGGGDLLYSSLAATVDEVLTAALKPKRATRFLISAQDMSGSAPSNAAS
jgi:uncharacterized membrane protein